MEELKKIVESLRFLESKYLDKDIEFFNDIVSTGDWSLDSEK